MIAGQAIDCGFTLTGIWIPAIPAGAGAAGMMARFGLDGQPHPFRLGSQPMMLCSPPAHVAPEDLMELNLKAHGQTIAEDPVGENAGVELPGGG